MKFNILWLFLLFEFVMSYKTSYVVKTNFKSKDSVIDVLMSSKFYISYLNHVGAEKIVTKPNIRLTDYKVDFPQYISYKSRPNVRCYPRIFPKMNIQQDWNRIDDYFYGDIKTDYLDSKIILKPVMDEMENWGISVDGEIVKKKVIIIPDKAFDDILRDFCSIFKISSRI